VVPFIDFMLVSEMTYNVSSEILIPAIIPYCTIDFMLSKDDGERLHLYKQSLSVVSKGIRLGNLGLPGVTLEKCTITT